MRMNFTDYEIELVAKCIAFKLFKHNNPLDESEWQDNSSPKPHNTVIVELVGDTLTQRFDLQEGIQNSPTLWLQATDYLVFHGYVKDVTPLGLYAEAKLTEGGRDFVKRHIDSYFR